MKRIALVALFALSIPAAAAAADPWRGPHPAPAPPATSTFRGDRQDVRELDRLMARYDEAVSQRDRRAMERLESRLLAAIDGEIAEARAALRRSSVGRGDRGDHGRSGRYGQVEDRRAEQVRFELARLTSLRAEFASLQGRFGWRATQRKHAVVAEVSRLARADLFRQPAPAPVAWNGHR